MYQKENKLDKQNTIHVYIQSKCVRYIYILKLSSILLKKLGRLSACQMIEVVFHFAQKNRGCLPICNFFLGHLPSFQ